MPEVPSPDWLSWAFWVQYHERIRDLVITIAALVGIPFVIWRELLHHRQTKAALQQAATAPLRHEAQVEADRERRITDNFTRAVEQLGSDKLETRLGAIYALERIARGSPGDHWPIMETLCAYVCERSPWLPNDRDLEACSDQGDKTEDLFFPKTDIQAALTLIGRRTSDHDLMRLHLNLMGADCRGAFLEGADLRNIDLGNSHFEEATLSQANLEGVWAPDAKFEKATFRAAKLGNCELGGAVLEGAFLDRADLQAASLGWSNLRKTSIGFANMRNSDLEGADLTEAELNGSILREAYLYDAKLDCASLEDADLMGARLRGATFEGANLKEANLVETDVTQEQFDSAITDERTMVPPTSSGPASRPTKVAKPQQGGAGPEH